MTIKNRIVGEGEIDAHQLVANPRNWRIHPIAQQQSLDEVLTKVGWVQRVTVNKRSGFVVDGHLRVLIAMEHGESVPVEYVDLDEAEEALILATLDPLASMAAADRDQLADLTANMEIQTKELEQTIGELLGDKSPFGDEEAVEVTVCARLPEQVADAFGASADGQGIAQADLMRLLVEQHLEAA